MAKGRPVNIILTGLRGTGKSSIGSALARYLSYRFVDTDAAIEEAAGCRIAEIVAQHGWPHFRELEQQVVKQIAAIQQQVIATGGGTLIDSNNARVLKTQGIVILLVCDLAILQRRIAFDKNRPSLTGQGSADTEIARVWEERKPYYHAVADITYDVSLESGNLAYDIQSKAKAIYTLLQKIPSFQKHTSGSRKPRSS